MDLWKPVFGLPPRRGSMGCKGRPIRRKSPCQAPMTPNRSKEPDKTSRLTNRRPDYSWRNDDHCSPVTAHTRCQARAHSRKRRGPELERLGTRTSGRGRPDRISRRWRAVRGLPEDVVLQFAWLFQLDLQLLGQPWLVKRSVLQLWFSFPRSGALVGVDHVEPEPLPAWVRAQQQCRDSSRPTHTGAGGVGQTSTK